MFNTARTTAGFVMPGDRIKLGGRPVVVVANTLSFSGRCLHVRPLHSPSSPTMPMPVESDAKFKVYNAK